MAVAIDTLAYARRLVEAGFSEQQAAGQAEALAAAMTDTLATKQDLRELEIRLEVRFARLEAQYDGRFVQVEARVEQLERRIDYRLEEFEKRTTIRFSEQTELFRRELADLERRMTVRLGGMMVASVGVASAIVRMLPA
jgi:hypothetical protein